jgi:hypothetical protein
LSAVRDCLFDVFAATLHNWRAFLHPQPDDAPCRGDRDPLKTVFIPLHLLLFSSDYIPPAAETASLNNENDTRRVIGLEDIKFKVTRNKSVARWKHRILQPFEVETCVFYIRTQCVPHCKHSGPRLYKSNLLTLYKAKVAVCFEIRTKHINAMWAPRRIF